MHEHSRRIARGAGPAIALLFAATSSWAQPAPAPARLVDLVQEAITQHAEALIQLRRVEIATGDLQTAHGQFDPVLASSVDRGRSYNPLQEAQRPPDVFAAIQNLTSYSVSLQKQFASGLAIQPNLSMTRTDVDLSPPVNGRGTVGLDVIQPLGRGRGSAAVLANERAARQSLASTELNYRFTAATVALRAVQAYWDYVSATKQVAVLTGSEARSRKLLVELQELVRADERPAADLKQLQADGASRAARRILAEQQLFAARYNLGLAAGLPLDRIAMMGPPEDEFPPAPDLLPAGVLDTPALTALALDRRHDLAAARRQELAAQELIVSTRDSLKPRVDLAANIGFSGLSEGDNFSRYFRPLFNQVKGGNVSFSLSYQWPLLNNAALGQALKAEATRQQASLQTGEVARQIGGRVLVSAEVLRRSLERLKISREAVALFESAVEDERARLGLGLSTVIDLLLTEDRLTQSQLDNLDAHSNFARAIAQMRFETGTMLADKAEPAVDATTLLTLPVR